jgi:hypothetical protein
MVRFVGTSRCGPIGPCRLVRIGGTLGNLGGWGPFWGATGGGVASESPLSFLGKKNSGK